MSKKQNSVKNNILTDEEIRNIVKYNPDGREIKDQNYVDFLVERYKDNKNISGIVTDTYNIEELLKKALEDSKKITTNEKATRNKQQELIINDLFNKISKTKFISNKVLQNENNELENVILNLEITKNGIKESIHKGMTNEKLAVIPYLDTLIQTSNDGIIRNEIKQRNNMKWYYLYNTAIINNAMYGVKIDIRKTPQGDRFYVHRVNLIHKEGTDNQIPSNESATIKINSVPSIDNSISQKQNSVKENTIVNNKSTQKNKNQVEENLMNWLGFEEK